MVAGYTRCSKILPSFGINMDEHAPYTPLVPVSVSISFTVHDGENLLVLFAIRIPTEKIEANEDLMCLFNLVFMGFIVLSDQYKACSYTGKITCSACSSPRCVFILLLLIIASLSYSSDDIVCLRIHGMQ